MCYLCLCEDSFPKKMAFAYLEDLSNEFYDQYGRKAHAATRPYSFIEFGKAFCRSISLLSPLRRKRQVMTFYYGLYFRHIHSENQENVRGQQSQESSRQHQHRTAGRAENNGGKY